MRFWATAWLVVLGILLLTGTSHNHAPVGLWLIIGAIAATVAHEFDRSER
jgi:hypothetical protein